MKFIGLKRVINFVHSATTRSTVLCNPEARERWQISLTTPIQPWPSTCSDEILSSQSLGQKKFQKESTVIFRDDWISLYNSFEYDRESSHAENQQ